MLYDNETLQGKQKIITFQPTSWKYKYISFHLCMFTNVFIGTETSNTSKQHMFSLYNKNQTSSQWTNQLITLQRVFSTFLGQCGIQSVPWHIALLCTWGVICPSTCWFQICQHPQSLRPDTLQVLGSAPGLWGNQTWFQTMRDHGETERCWLACLFN